MCLTRIVHGLAKNSSIWWFSAQCGTLGISACKAIAANMEVNRRLCCITLGGPYFNEECLSVVSAATAKNPMIQIMGLAYQICRSMALEIRDSLRRNMSMMLQAVEFVLAPTVSKVEAQAFEKYKENPFYHLKQGKPTIS
ncbi:hypothetical protein V5799_017655 [Amblyomma americanum]|uniref:Uncharacterized protein n=1 Tax=Amblyomma americanum TaxID=6943 RepID=A0AAQ4F1H8_AMBAM